MFLKPLLAFKPYARWRYGKLLAKLDEQNANTYTRLVAISAFMRNLSLDKCGVRVISKVKLNTKFKNIEELRNFVNESAVLIKEDLEGIELINGYRNDVKSRSLNSWFITTDGYRIDELEGYATLLASSKSIIDALETHKNNKDSFLYQCSLCKFLLNELIHCMKETISIQIGNQTP